LFPYEMAEPPLVSMMLEGLPVSVDPLKTTVLAPLTCTAAVVLLSTTLCSTNAVLATPPDAVMLSQCGWPIADRYCFPDHGILNAIAAFDAAAREEPRSIAGV
jgi:hypothetical protein